MGLRVALLLAISLLSTVAPWSTAQCRDEASSLFFGFAVDGLPVTPARLETLSRAYGRSPDMIVFFLQWPRDPSLAIFPRDSLDAVAKTGAMPCLTWEPMVVFDGKETAVMAEDILNGRHDAYIDAMARMCRLFGRPMILRPAHEMNLSRYHWGGPPETYGPDSPSRYRAMYRYLVARFRAAGADNVLFAFCPNAESIPDPIRDGAAWNTARTYYPGDDVVDVLGMDGYNWGTTQTRRDHGWESVFRSFPDIFGPLYKELKALSPAKPVVVFETASVTQGGDKRAWILKALETAISWGLAGLVWFEADKEVDWRLASSIGPGPATFLGDILGPVQPGRKLFLKP